MTLCPYLYAYHIIENPGFVAFRSKALQYLVLALFVFAILYMLYNLFMIIVPTSSGSRGLYFGKAMMMLIVLVLLMYFTPVFTMTPNCSKVQPTDYEFQTSLGDQGSFFAQVLFYESSGIKLYNSEYSFKCVDENCERFLVVTEDEVRTNQDERLLTHMFTCEGDNNLYIVAGRYRTQETCPNKLVEGCMNTGHQNANLGVVC